MTEKNTGAVIRVPFNKSFREANRTRARYRLLCGSAGSGKSYNAAQDFILKLSDRRYAGAGLLVLRKNETSCRHSVFAELVGAVRRIFGGRWGEFWSVRQEPMELECRTTGCRILFRGMKDAAARERVKSIAFPGGKLCWIWMEEATEFSEEDLEILDDRLRGDLSPVNADLYYQITMTFNPVSARHFLKRRFFDAPPSAQVFLSRTVYGENAFIDGDYAARMERRRETDPRGYRVYALGEWGGSEGLILPHYRVEEISQEDGWDHLFMAQDFGYHHANCLLLLGYREGVLGVLRELYVTGLDTQEIIERAVAEGFPRDKLMYCDAAEPDRIKTWRRAGFRALAVKKGPGSVLSQIQRLSRESIVIHPSCRGTLEEIGAWSWLRDPLTGEFLDEPAPGRDDAMAALRYATEHLRLREMGPRSLPKAALGL